MCKFMTILCAITISLLYWGIYIIDIIMHIRCLCDERRIIKKIEYTMHLHITELTALVGRY